MRIVTTFLALAAASAAGFTAAVALQDEGMMPMAQATEHHQVLKQFAGNWDGTMSMMGQESKVEYTVEHTLGELWSIGDFKGDFGGMPFAGHDVMGYDPEDERYVAVWVDSMNPKLTRSQGTYDAAKKMLVLEPVDAPPGPTGALRYTFTGADTMLFEMVTVGPDGAETVDMKIEYTRRK